MMKVTDCTPYILNDIDLVVITTSSVYCDHEKNNKQTDKQNIKLLNKKKANEKKNKRKKTNKE